jgi:hypothetical protein
LFATGFYDRVHDLKPHQMLRNFPLGASGTACMETGEPLIIHGMGFRVKNYSQMADGVVCRQACMNSVLIFRQSCCFQAGAMPRRPRA